MPNKYSKRSRNLFNPESEKPFPLSRSRLENFTKCPRCFYLDRRLGLDRPSSIPFNLNSAVDHLLKKEFDLYRAQQKPHPLMVENGINAVPFAHPELETWRENFKGLKYEHKESGFLVSGAIDDLWVTPQNEMIVVDYKSTSKDGEVSLDGEWRDSYKRQMEIYQWLLRRMGFTVSPTGYFVYANARKDCDAFNATLSFKMSVLPYQGSDAWVEPTLVKASKCLKGKKLPPASKSCEFCAYRAMISEVEWF